jgi:hypothetical protein
MAFLLGGDFMQMPQIRLESTFAKLGMTTTKPIQEIQQPPADLSIEQPKADLKIETTKGKLSIDQSQARADVDLKSIARRIEEFAQQGYQDWLSGMARVAQDGDQLMRNEEGGNPLIEQAKINSETPIYDFNIGWIPSHGSVKINYTPANVKIDVQVNKPNIQVQVNKAITSYTQGKNNFELAQQNTLKIDFNNLRYVGINYEQEI